MDLGISALIARALQSKETNKETPPNIWLLTVQRRKKVAENKSHLGWEMVL